MCKVTTVYQLLFALVLLHSASTAVRAQPKKCRGRQCRILKTLTARELEPYRPELNPFLYTEWSKWSRCDAQCSTYRLRKCLFPTVCGDRMTVYESAFCYRRGSYCELLYLSRPQKPKDKPKPVDQSYYQLQHLNEGYNRSTAGGGKDRSRIPFQFTEFVQVQRPPQTETMQKPVRVPSRNKTRRHGHFRKNRRFPTGSIRYNYITALQDADEKAFRRKGQAQPTCGVPVTTERNYSSRFQLRILGGREAEQGRWPWQVAVLNRAKEVFCGGTLIGPRWILTAAHCVRRRMHVRLGEHHIHVREGTEKQYRIQTAFIHPEYDPETVNNDIALLQLPEPIPFDNGLACLPEQNAPLPSPNTMCTILGWGKQQHTHVHGTSSLQEGKVPIVSSAECRMTYPYEVTSNMFCAGYKAGRVDSCAGDSGGPILCPVENRWTIYGVTSFGDGCGRKGKYGIYAKVSNYISWIRRLIKANESLD